MGELLLDGGELAGQVGGIDSSDSCFDALDIDRYAGAFHAPPRGFWLVVDATPAPARGLVVSDGLLRGSEEVHSQRHQAPEPVQQFPLLGRVIPPGERVLPDNAVVLRAGRGMVILPVGP